MECCSHRSLGHTTVRMPEDGCQQADFLRMTTLLKRIQDVMEEQNFQRPENYVRLSRSIQLPAPVEDFLSTIGTFTSSIIGVCNTLTVADSPARNPPTWWTNSPSLSITL